MFGGCFTDSAILLLGCRNQALPERAKRAPLTTQIVTPHSKYSGDPAPARHHRRHSGIGVLRFWPHLKKLGKNGLQRLIHKRYQLLNWKQCHISTARLTWLPAVSRGAAVVRD